jgi:hypothetical protein
MGDRPSLRPLPILTEHQTMKAYLGVEVYLHTFLTSAIDGCEWSTSRPGRFILRERATDTHWIGVLSSSPLPTQDKYTANR